VLCWHLFYVDHTQTDRQTDKDPAAASKWAEYARRVGDASQNKSTVGIT